MKSIITLLIVDDQPENLAVLSDSLESRYRVLVATTGERALQLAVCAPQPDLILLDVTMPGMDGYEVLGHLHQDAATRDIPVIFVTGNDADIDQEHGLKIGAADYITKPVRPAILQARVQIQLENRRARDLLQDHNAQLSTEISQRMHDNEVIQDVSLHILAGLAELRDTDTGAHLYRTQTYISELAKEFRRIPNHAGLIDDDLARNIVRAAPLHDIGKVGIPDRILQKPDRLTAEEYAIIQTHSRIGGDAIAMALQRVQEIDPSSRTDNSAGLAFLVVAGQIARSHHERWDGTGYPDRLAGEAIPLPARMMALADVYDALVTPRIYKQAVTHSQAVDIIRAECGKHFDPVLTEVFLHSHSRFAEVSLQFQGHCRHRRR